MIYHAAAKVLDPGARPPISTDRGELRRPHLGTGGTEWNLARHHESAGLT
jgi:hypothetical protein